MSNNELEILIESVIKSHPKLTQEAISKAVGYNEGYISQALSRGKWSKTFIKLVKAQFANGNDSEGLQNQNPGRHDIASLIRANEDLSRANKDLAAANLSLTKMVTAGDAQEMSEAAITKLDALQELVFDFLSEKFPSTSIEELDHALGKRVALKRGLSR